MTIKVEKKFQDQQDQFIYKVDELLDFYEWDAQLVSQAEEECGFEQGYASILNMGETDEIITAYEVLQDKKMLELLAELSAPLKVREKIALALKTRIKNCCSKIILKKNQRLLSSLENLALAAKLAWETCDNIWRYAGDNSTDFNYYSKRGLLVGVYVSSIVFYINDESENSVKTDDYIDKSLTKIINIANFKNIIKLPKLEDIPILRLFS